MVHQDDVVDVLLVEEVKAYALHGTVHILEGEPLGLAVLAPPVGLARPSGSRASSTWRQCLEWYFLSLHVFGIDNQ